MPVFYNKSNNYLEVVRNLRIKHGQNLNNNFVPPTACDHPPKKKVFNLDLRKSNKLLPNYVTSNIPTAHASKIEAAFATNLPTAYVSNTIARQNVRGSPERKRKVQIPIERIMN